MLNFVCSLQARKLYTTMHVVKCIIVISDITSIRSFKNDYYSFTKVVGRPYSPRVVYGRH